MNIDIKYTNQIQVGATKHVIYGKAKIGKTRLSLTSPVLPLVVSTEKGLLSLRKERVPYVEADNVAELANIYNYIISAQGNKFGLIMFDSVSDLGEVVVGDNKKRTKDGRKAYGDTNDTVMQIWRDYRAINKHVVFIAKEDMFQGMGGTNMFRPMMPDKYLTQQLPYMFDVIAHYTNFVGADGQTYAGLHTRNDFQTVAGDRSGTLAEWEPPNLAQLINKIERG